MSRPAILFIDLQNAVFDGKLIPPAYKAETLLENATALLNAARQCGVPVVHIQHCGAAGEVLEESSPGWPIYAPLAPQRGEPVVRKCRSSAFEETELDATLRRLDARTLLILGIQSEHCVAATCRSALLMGYGVQLAEDCHSTWPDGDCSALEIVSAQNREMKSCGVELRSTTELVRAIYTYPATGDF